jgi:hypothetical protein
MATYTWTGAISDDVSLAGNYSPTSGPPGPGDTVNQNGSEETTPGSGSITVAIWNVAGNANEDGGDNGDFTINAGAFHFTTSGYVGYGTWNGPATFTRGNIQGGTWNGTVSATDASARVTINNAIFNSAVTLDTTGGAGHGIIVNVATFNAPVSAGGSLTHIGADVANCPTLNAALTLSSGAYVCNVKLGNRGSLVFPTMTLYAPQLFLPRGMTGGYNG